MAVFTDSPEFAALVLPERIGRNLAPVQDPEPGVRTLLRTFLQETAGLAEAPAGEWPWACLLLGEVAFRSNFDAFIELVRRGVPIPDRTVCMAGSGRGFRGFKGRAWAAVPGNLHLSVHFAPERPVPRFEVAFTILAAVSVVDAIDGTPGLDGRAGLVWVNDVVLDEAKVGGVLAYTHTRGNVVSSAVLGIGVNVQTRPAVEPTPFVPAVTCLGDHVAQTRADLRRPFFARLLEALDRNYTTLLAKGYEPLLARYRERSVFLDRNVAICTEDSDRVPTILSSGRVTGLGPGLELHVQGRPAPVTRGRMILGDRRSMA